MIGSCSEHTPNEGCRESRGIQSQAKVDRSRTGPFGGSRAVSFGLENWSQEIQCLRMVRRK